LASFAVFAAGVGGNLSEPNGRRSPAANATGQASSSAAAEVAVPAGQLRGAPLSDVVADGVHRWFQETLREAQRGDVKHQALLGEMLLEGYGCEPDPVVSAPPRRRCHLTAGHSVRFCYRGQPISSVLAETTAGLGINPLCIQADGSPPSLCDALLLGPV